MDRSDAIGDALAIGRQLFEQFNTSGKGKKTDLVAWFE